MKEADKVLRSNRSGKLHRKFLWVTGPLLGLLTISFTMATQQSLGAAVSVSTNRCASLFESRSLPSEFDTNHAKLTGVELVSGGKILTFRPVGDVFDIDQNRVDPHGSLWQPTRALEGGAPFWGFRKISASSGIGYTQGDVAYLNSRRTIFNSGLNDAQKIPVHFEEAESALIPNAKFVRAHGQHRVLIARSGHGRMHDIHYHVVSSLFVPRFFEAEAARKSEILSDFYDFAFARTDRADVRNALDHLLALRAAEIDLIANVQEAYGSSKIFRDLEGNFLHYMKSYARLNDYAYVGKSQAQYLTLAVEGLSETHFTEIAVLRALSKSFLSQAASNPTWFKAVLPEQSESFWARAILHRAKFVESRSERLGLPSR